jgi:SAM-dependent methyltransferase
MPRDKIAFDVTSRRDIAGYDGKLGKWWQAQAENTSHRYAYRKVADYIRASFVRSPRLIVDYACGAGHLLTRLCNRFPEARLVGLDGSTFLLNLARRRLAHAGCHASTRTSLIDTSLPHLNMPRLAADLVIFAFPNMVPSGREAGFGLDKDSLRSVDPAVAEVLAHLADSQDDPIAESPETIQFELMLGRLVSLNLRKLLKRGGVCVRVEYAKARRHELSRADLLRVAFEEGSLDMKVSGKLPPQWFRVAASTFFRSRVMEDVYQQTGDERDRDGGYVITVLRAV